MTIKNFDIELEAEASWTTTFTWLDPSTTFPIDLTGFTAKAQFRSTFGDANSQLDLTTANGGIVLGGTDGTITIVITDVQTTALGTSLLYMRGFYDLFLTNPLTTPHTVTKYLEGFVYVNPAITALP